MNPRGLKNPTDADAKAAGKSSRKRNSSANSDVGIADEDDEHVWKRRLARRSAPANDVSSTTPSLDASVPNENDAGRPSIELDKVGDGMSRAIIPSEWMNTPPGPVRLSNNDRSPALTFVDGPKSRLMVRGFKGYRMVRATHGVCEGDWFFEARICSYDGDGAVRFGWSTRRSDVETPVGFDGQGFGIRDRTGEFIHLAQLRKYGEPFGPGDVIGCRIKLPKASDQVKKSIAESDYRWLEYRFICYLQGKPPRDTGLTLNNSFVEFYKNGSSLGIPSYFSGGSDTQKSGQSSSGIPAGLYFPSVALYKNAVVQVNFGPTFDFAPPKGCRPLSECAPKLLPSPQPSDEAPPQPEDSEPVKDGGKQTSVKIENGETKALRGDLDNLDSDAAVYSDLQHMRSVTSSGDVADVQSPKC